MKILIATLALVSTSAFAFINDGDVNNEGQTQMNGNAEGRGTANFTMSFSGSATTKGDFNGNGNTYAEKRDVYRPPFYGNPNYNFPVEEK